jgi:hypothetical protein
MSLRSSSARAAFGRLASKDEAHLDNRLAFFDQATFLSLRATGRAQLTQIVWIYEHPIDFDALRRLHRTVGHGLVGRRIERSPLPFGRHRWVASVGLPLDIDIAEYARPRAQLSDWADERAQLPIDPEWGPGWHMGVLPLLDGSTAVSIVASHCLVDAFGGFATLIDAIKGNVRDFGYPPPRSRSRVRAVVSDARETVQGAPEVARAFSGAARLLFRQRRDIARPATSRSTTTLADGADCNVIVPTVSVYIALDDWDARAKSLGGTSYSLLAGVAARLGGYLGRRRSDDGTVTLLIPISDRTMHDTRAIAMSYVKVSVDPTQVTTDVSGARVAIRQALTTARELPDQALQLLPLTPFIPKRAVKRAADLLFGFANLAVVCSNLGDLDPAVARPDGTDAEYVTLRGVDQNVTRQYIESAGGQLVVVGGRLVGKMSISVVAYQPGGKNSKQDLRELVTSTLAEFDLTGIIE